MVKVSRNCLALYRGCLNSLAVESGLIVSVLDCLLSIVLKDGNNR